MSIEQEIKEQFSGRANGMRQLNRVGLGYPAWTFRENERYGVAIPYNGEEFHESFNSCYIDTESFSMLGANVQSYLILSAFGESSRNEFASICTHFVDPGENGMVRAGIEADPKTWWLRWRDLMGNAVREKNVYDVIAEMLVLKHLYEQDHSIQWTAAIEGTKDIENDVHSYEVKSTKKRENSEITISSVFQLDTQKPVSLYFCRVEESAQGVSVEDAKELLVTAGFDGNIIEDRLQNMGIRNSFERSKKFRILEVKRFEVDDNFPRITLSSFKGDSLPNGVTKIKYSVDLNGLQGAVVQL